MEKPMKVFNKFVAGLTLASLSCLSQASLMTYDNNTPTTIPDESTITSSINITTHGTVNDVNLLIKTLFHTFDPDLSAWLSHGAVSVNLFDQLANENATGFINTLFDDEAAKSITQGNVYPPYTGTYKPAELLSAFDGMDAFGTWTLTITDNWAGDSGSLESWSLTVDSTKVPEPTPLMLIAAGLLALVTRRLSAK